MVKKIQVTVTFEPYVYVPDPNSFDNKNMSIDDMAKADLDCEGFEELVLNDLIDNGKFKLSYKIIDEDE